MSDIYIPRRLQLEGQILTEQDVLNRTNLLVVLATPGAGKTDLLKFLASLLNVEPVRASVFRNRRYSMPLSALVIDAMDEVAKISDIALNDIIVKAQETCTGTVIFASRSGEWDKARTKFTEDCFGMPLTEIRLDPLNATEQQQLFQHVFPDENFEAFGNEIKRFDLTPLLGNPEFLQLFGHAYIESERKFSGKRKIYSDAAKRLASECNEGQSHKNRPNASRIVEQAGGVFARLLLSGASGVSKVDLIKNCDFPHTSIVSGDAPDGLDYLLDSKLFKPANDTNEHEPVHRIVAEFLAAEYLSLLMKNHLSPKRGFAIIAPNGVVRDELRGMLGWLAALGDEYTQSIAIKIDPYAVLANGDPAQLSANNKKLLIEQLKALKDKDPYFRRSDAWRPFNVGQFFTDDMVDYIAPILSINDESHLRPLFLEILEGAPIIRHLDKDLMALVLCTEANYYDRRLAFNLLRTVPGNKAEIIFDPLLSENSPCSLDILSELVQVKAVDTFGISKVVELLKCIAKLRSREGMAALSNYPGRHFIKLFLTDFPTEKLENILDQLTDEIVCFCKPEHEYRCACRTDVSKVASDLLDRYFSTNLGPYDPSQIWKWLRNLRFHSSYFHPSNELKSSASIGVLNSQHDLRRNIQKIAFSNAAAQGEIEDLTRQFWNFHFGIQLSAEDILFHVNQAFQTNNIILWRSMWRRHLYESDKKGPDTLRSLMRQQACKNQEMQRIWTQLNRASKHWWKENRPHYSTHSNKYARREKKRREEIFESLRSQRDIIEAGNHWPWLLEFATYYIYEPEKLGEIVDKIETVHRALRNCLPFLSDHVPSLQQLARREYNNVALVLFAACVIRFREQQSLKDVPMNVLVAAKTECGSREGVPEDESNALETEIDRLLFPQEWNIEAYIRNYLEPQLAEVGDFPTNVALLDHKPLFNFLRNRLPLEWLKRFPDMPELAEQSLFKMAVKHSDAQELRLLINDRIKLYLDLPENTPQRRRRDFWLGNSFIYSHDEKTWMIARSHKNFLLSLENRLGRFSDREDSTSPRLSVHKIYMILDAFVEHWPEVELPSSHGTSSPPTERAYRFLRELPWILTDAKPEEAIPVIDQLISDPRFLGFKGDLLTIRASCLRRRALHNFAVPSPVAVARLLEGNDIASVEDLRALMVETLERIETEIRTSETNTLEVFYKNGKHVDENTARDRIVEQVKSFMRAKSLSVVIEHHMAENNRCDFTATHMSEGERKLLTIEIKGQWHRELFTAAETQLNKQYASHADAGNQGIYLVLWFGADVSVSGKNHEFKTTDQLKSAIIAAMPADLHGYIDVVVINLSRNEDLDKAEKTKKPKRTV